MISRALFKRDLHVSLKLWLVITAVLLLLLSALLYATSGMEGSGVTVVQQFYTLFAALIPVFYLGTTGTRLIAAQVDNGSFSCVMSAPLRRRQVALTQACFLILSLAAMYVLFFAAGVVALSIWDISLEIGTFLLMNLGSFLLNLTVGGIAFLASCAFNSAGAATAMGVGLPLAFFLLHVMATFFGGNELLGLCRYLTINSLYSPADIVARNGSMVHQFLGLLVTAAGLFLAGGVVFDRKDLPL